MKKSRLTFFVLFLLILVVFIPYVFAGCDETGGSTTEVTGRYDSSVACNDVINQKAKEVVATVPCNKLLCTPQATLDFTVNFDPTKAEGDNCIGKITLKWACKSDGKPCPFGSSKSN